MKSYRPRQEIAQCFSPVILLGHTGSTDPGPGSVTLGEQLSGGEDKPGKVPQTLHGWKESLLGWVWFSGHWSPTLPAQGRVLATSPRPVATATPAPTSGTSGHLSQPPCAARGGTQTQPMSSFYSFSLRFCIYSFFNL